jgi:nucleotide-binding universal stress UspA family protein
MAKRDRATLTIVHVTDPRMPVSAAQSAAYADWEDREKQSRAWAQRQLARMTASATKAGVHAEAVLAAGSAAREIVRAARRRHSELVVIGTHGRRGLATLFLGSVAAGSRELPWMSSSPLPSTSGFSSARPLRFTYV